MTVSPASAPSTAAPAITRRSATAASLWPSSSAACSPRRSSRPGSTIFSGPTGLHVSADSPVDQAQVVVPVAAAPGHLPRARDRVAIFTECRPETLREPCSVSSWPKTTSSWPAHFAPASCRCRAVWSAPRESRHCEHRFSGRGPRNSLGPSISCAPFHQCPCSRSIRGRRTADDRRTALTTDVNHKPLVSHVPILAQEPKASTIKPFAHCSVDSVPRQVVGRWIQAKGGRRHRSRSRAGGSFGRRDPER